MATEPVRNWPDFFDSARLCAATVETDVAIRCGGRNVSVEAGTGWTTAMRR